MKQQINTDVISLLNSGGSVVINLTGVSFDNRQAVIGRMITDDSPRNITLHAEIDNKYDEYAISVQNNDGEIIGYIPKQKGFTVTIPNRHRPIVFSKYTADENGKPVQTNEIFYRDIQKCEYTGEISRYQTSGKPTMLPSMKKIPIGVQIKFWKVCNEKEG